MKTWIIALPFVCAASVAMAQDGAQPDTMMAPAERAAAESRAADAPAAAATKHRATRQGARSLPRGDVRHCLDRKTRAEVIRCSETRQRK